MLVVVNHRDAAVPLVEYFCHKCATKLEERHPDADTTGRADTVQHQYLLNAKKKKKAQGLR